MKIKDLFIVGMFKGSWEWIYTGKTTIWRKHFTYVKRGFKIMFGWGELK